MSRYTPYIIVALLFLGALLIWWLPPVRMRIHADEPTRQATHHPAAPHAEVPATPTATAAKPHAG